MIKADRPGFYIILSDGKTYAKKCKVASKDKLLGFMIGGEDVIAVAVNEQGKQIPLRVIGITCRFDEAFIMGRKKIY